MTIGIAATGPHAGTSVLTAVLGVELLGRGAIGGFAVFTAIDSQGQVHRATTQQGGVQALEVSTLAREAHFAAMISSGPDRPEPLSQFLAAKPGIGLVTGHRLPNRPGEDGIALNEAVLARLSAGEHPQHVVDAVLHANPESDAGLIALDTEGRFGWADSVRVRRRSDRGSGQRADSDRGVVLLHNSIFANCALAESAVDLAWGVLTKTAVPTCLISLASPVPVVPGTTDRVHVSPAGKILRIETANPNLMRWRGVQTVIYLDSEVWEDGRQVGYAGSELFAQTDGTSATPLPNRDVFVMRRGSI